MLNEYTEMACCSECGNVRSHNEDAVTVDNQAGFCVLADGMGGADAGEIASSAVVERLQELLGYPRVEMTPEDLCRAVADKIQEVDLWLQNLTKERGYRNGCGTTVVVFVRNPWYPDRAFCFSIGDSRLYRYRDGVLECITVDHTIAAETGISENHLPQVYRGMLTRAVGFGMQGLPDRYDLQMKNHDLYFLCSDGLTKVFDNQQLTGLLHFLRKHSVENVARVLVSCVLDCGAPDNVTVAAVRIGKIPAADFVPENDLLLEEQNKLKNWKGWRVSR